MMESLKMNLLQGKYNEAEATCRIEDMNSIKDILMRIAYDTESICVYSFIRYMIEKTGKSDWIELAVDVMIHPLCFVEGAYSIALYHTRELLLIERSVENLEKMIFFYEIPERLVEKEEVQYIVKEILDIDPNNEVAMGQVKYENVNKGLSRE